MIPNIEEGKMAAEERCVYGDIECFGMVVPVWGSVERSTRQGDLISIRSSVFD